MANMTNEEKLARKAELEAKRAAREVAKEGRKLDLELQALELEEKYEKELGPRGKAWELVDISELEDAEPFIVVKPSDIVSYKKFQAAINADKPIYDTCFAFAAPAVVHPREAIGEIFDRRPAAAVQCASALQTLAGQHLADRKKTY